jgi:GDP-fucose transporter C1
MIFLFSFQVANLTLKGIFFGLLSSIFAALNGVYIKKTINLVDNNLWKLNFLTNFYASIIFLPLSCLFGEMEQVFQFPNLFTGYFWFAMSLSGVLGFLTGFVTSLQIQVTSPLTHNISGTTKSYLQTVLGVLVYNETKSLLWWMSNFLVLIGAGLYSNVRTQEMRDNHMKIKRVGPGEKA